jgi:MFS family permease
MTDGPAADAAVPAAAPARGDGFRALRHPGYRIYFGGMLFRGMAVWSQLLSIPWYALQLGAGPAELGVVTALLFAPTLVVSPLGGVLADRVDRGRVLLLTQSGSFVLSLGLAIMAATGAGTLPLILLGALAFGILTAIELPVRQAYVTELVPHEDLSSAVSLHATAWNTTRFLGPAVAGVLIATVGVTASFVLACTAVLVVTVSIAVLERYRRPDRAPAAPSDGVLRSLRVGIAYALSDQRIRWSLAYVTSVGVLGIQTFQTLAPVYVTEVLGLGGGGYGAFIATWGGGAVVAAYVITAVARGDRRRWLASGSLVLAGALVALAVTELLPLAFATAFVLGFAQISVVQNAMITIQMAAPDELRGRVMGLYTTIFAGVSPLGAIVAGAVAEAIGVQPTFVLAGIGLLAVGIFGAVGLRQAAFTAPAGR